MRNKLKIGLAVILGAIAASLPIALSGSAAQTFVPDNLPLTKLSENNRTVTYGWTPVQGYGYLFKTQASAGADWVVVSRTNDPTVSSVRFSKGSYDYAVGALGEVAVGKASEIPPPPDTTPPSNPTNLASSGVSRTGFSVNWTASTDNVAVTGYDVLLNGTNNGPVTATSFTFTGLNCATQYNVGVRAFDAAGNNSSTTTTSVTTSDCGLSAPMNVHVNDSTQTSINFGWDAVTGATNYRTYVDGVFYKQGAGSSGGFTDTMNVTGLTCGTSYDLAVEAQNATETSPQGHVTGSTLDCPVVDTQPPSNPTGLSTSDVGQQAATLNWIASNDNVGVDHYNMFLNGTAVGGPVSGSPFAFSSLTCNTSYTLGVQAEDAAGNKSTVVTTNVTTSNCDQPPPGDNVVQTNQKWTCDGPVNLDLVKITVDSSHFVTPAVQIASGCSGTIDRIEIDTANGDGIHVGAFAHDLTVGGGYVRSPLGGCTLCGALHVDGIQFLGGQRITFNNLDVNFQTASNSALYINQGSGGQERPTDIVFNNSTFRRSPTRNRVVRIGNSLRSGIRNSTVYWCGTGPTCDAPSADAIWGNGLADEPVGVTYVNNPDGTTTFTGPTPDNTLVAVGG